MKTVNNEMYVLVCCKSPTVTEDDQKNLFSIIQEVLTHPVILMQDFNYPSINWDCLGRYKVLDFVQDSFYIGMWIDQLEGEIF